jgi:Mce-associated membrane protein
MEGDAGASQLSPTDADDSPESGVGADDLVAETAGNELGDAHSPVPQPVDRAASRIGRGWSIGIVIALVILSGGLATGGYLALLWHRDSERVVRDDAAAVEAAKNCIAATQAPDIDTMAASEQKIIDCGTGDFRTQAMMYTGLLVQAYQAANVHVQVSDMRAAVDRNNDDGSVDVLVAMRVKVNDIEVQNQETGYRLRVKMARDEGRYKIARLDQVAK